MTVNLTENARGAAGYGSIFCTKPISCIERNLTRLKRMPADRVNTSLPSYESFSLLYIWYNIRNGRWPHLRAYENYQNKTCGYLLRDWTDEYMLIATPFDMGPYEVMVGMRIPIALKRNIHEDLKDQIFVGLFTEDQQSVADYLNDESMEFLALFFQQLKPMDYHLDFECDPFFFSEMSHTKGLMSFSKLLDHLETVYNTNSPDILCPTKSSTYLPSS